MLMETTKPANDNGFTVAHTGASKFEIGKTYATRSICDWDCIHSFKILARTAKSVTVEVRGETVRRGVSSYEGVEQFKPFGSYSMAAIISADKELKAL